MVTYVAVLQIHRFLANSSLFQLYFQAASGPYDVEI